MTIYEVAEAFVEGRDAKSPGKCPGGAYVTSEGDFFYSYCTEVGARLRGGSFAVTTKKYSVSTSNHVRKLEDALRASGYSPEDLTVDIETKVPGRWGGYGPAWHPTGYETYPFTVWSK